MTSLTPLGNNTYRLEGMPRDSVTNRFKTTTTNQPIDYLSWHGVTKTLPSTDMDMGRGSFRNLPQYGLRRAIWDAAFGYVSGFPKRDIVYYILTRSLSKSLSVYAMKREGITFIDGVPVAR